MRELVHRLWKFAATALALIALVTQAQAAQLQFSIELNPPYQGNAVCNVSYHRVPNKAAVDKMMLDALAICRTVDPAHDIQVMAFRDDDALGDAEKSYRYLVWRHATGRLEKVGSDAPLWTEH
jgi:hypothetical protein